MGDPWVEGTQIWYNATYGGKPGFQTIPVSGQTGWSTMYALTRALQFELGLTTLSDNFGAGTLAALTAYGDITAANPNTAQSPSNLIKIAQGALYCKGYNASNGARPGTWTSGTQEAVATLRSDLGLDGSSSALTPKLFKFLLTMEAATLLPGGDSVVRDGQRAMNARYSHRRDYYLIAADGHFLRDTHRALMFAIQYEIGMEDGVANGNLGPGTKSGLQNQANLSVGSSDTTRCFVKLFHFALRVNGYPTAFTSTFTASTATSVETFQAFVKLPVSGTATLQTWASLLVSTGDPDRSGTGADCITTLSDLKLTTLRNAGYTHFGRYLTNAVDHDPDKDIKHGELSRIFAAGGKVFPLFQTGGGSPTHFTPQRGAEVAEEAAVAAWGYRLPANSIIYFSVDYDAYDWEVTASIIPYFRAVNAAISSWGRTYRVGIYGPRNVCKRVSAEELAVASFVSDMSTGYSGNLGHTMPTNWAFDQIRTLTVGSGGAAIEIDKNIVSGRDPGVSVLAAATNVGVDPLIPSHSFEAFAADWYDNCVRHRDSDVQLPIMALNRDAVKERVAKQDAFITRLAGDHGVYKAMILTPLIWESMVINVLDDAKDKDVNAHYVLRENGDSTALFPADDSSTGVCQIFARTAIDARNWAVGQGLLSGRLYNKTVWQDMWEIWKALHHDDEFNITTAMFIMMREAVTRTGVPADQLRNLTPSQVMRACSGYNGDGVYGRRRMTLFYLIQRWHEAFR